MTASPPWAVTAAGDVGRVGCDRNPANPGLSARRSTWTIIGTPAMSSSGLPGRRLDAMRAGISTKVRFVVIGTGAKETPGELVGIVEIRRVYTGCQSTGKPISQAVLGVRCESLLPGLSHRPRDAGPLDLPAWSLIRNGLLRNQ